MDMSELETLSDYVPKQQAAYTVVYSMHLWNQSAPVQFLVLPLPNCKTLKKLFYL